MSVLVLILAGSAATLFVLALLFSIEDRRSRRYLVLGGLRRALDHFLLVVAERLRGWHHYLGSGFLRLLMHYLVHNLLRNILRSLRWVESVVERTLRHNRRAARRIDTEKQRTHLDEIADHKTATALTERQKQKRLAHD